MNARYRDDLPGSGPKSGAPVVGSSAVRCVSSNLPPVRSTSRPKWRVQAPDTRHVRRNVRRTEHHWESGVSDSVAPRTQRQLSAISMGSSGLYCDAKYWDRWATTSHTVASPKAVTHSTLTYIATALERSNAFRSIRQSHLAQKRTPPRILVQRRRNAWSSAISSVRLTARIHSRRK